MSVSDVIVIAFCAAMITAGVTMIRLSRSQRGMGGVAIVLGVLGLLAWATAEHGAPPPPNATPTHELDATARSTTDAP